MAAAKAAFPAWSRSGLLARHAVLRKASDEITARKDEIGRALAREEGKTLVEGIGETVRAAQIFDFFAGETLRLSGELVPSVRPGVGVEITREAVGVVGIITPWNFPIAIPAWKIAPALAYGNTIVVKPAELVPESAWTIVDILHRAGLPKGVLNLVMGKGSVVGQAMLDSPDLNAITFTGSVIAFLKLDGRMSGKPIMIGGRHFINAALGIALIVLIVLLVTTESKLVFWLIVAASLVLGVLLIIPIGGADMPVVVSMLNSYSGWAAAALGFTLGNLALIITGALVGSSGAILSYIMCKGMNRSFISVILGGFGGETSAIA
ncbi:MAG: aldehyde dehydrogenase family protein, partial [Mesorhizobium sp.]